MNNKTPFQKFIFDISNRIYKQLGPGHNESIYHKALMYELMVNNIKADTEKHIYVTYTDTACISHTLVSERIDVYIHNDINSVFTDIQQAPIVIELKAVAKTIGPVEEFQVLKYFRELKKEGLNIDYGILINFQQPTARFSMPDYTEFKIIKNEYKEIDTLLNNS